MDSYQVKLNMISVSLIDTGRPQKNVNYQIPHILVYFYGAVVLTEKYVMFP